jgi:GTP-binding protein
MVLRSLRAIDRSQVALLVLESGGVIEQDTKIAGYAHEAGKAVIVAVNKWDLIEKQWNPAKPTGAQKDYLGEIARYLPFISYAPVHFISAIEGNGVAALLDDAVSIAPNVSLRVSTGELNSILRRAMGEHPPPSSKGQPVKIRYITQAETTPPRIVVFCNRPDDLHFSYVRYLENQIRALHPFRGVPLKIEVRKSSEDREKGDR